MNGAGADRWYAVCCKPRHERVAEENLLRQGYRVYLPLLRVRKRRRGQWADVVQVLFPRYAFIRLDIGRRSTWSVRSTRGVVDLVRFGGRPAVVPDAVIDALVRLEDADSGSRQSRPLFRAGEPVKLVDGPLSGMEGIFAQQNGDERVLVLLDLLGKTNEISVSRDWIAKAA